MLLSLILTAQVSLPMPPPPPGMVALATTGSADAGSVAAEEVAPQKKDDADDDEPGASELDEMRALEAVVIEPKAHSDVQLRLELSRLGPFNPVRDRLEAALQDAEDHAEELPFALQPIQDLASFDVSRVKDRYDIPVEMQPLVAQYLGFFTGGGRKWFRRWMSRSTRYLPMMQPILESRGLPRDTVFLSMIESGFNTSARSWAAAVGPWQFIPGTAKRFNLKADFWVDERRDPVKATHAAARYLNELYGESGHWYLAWAGYNCGGGKIKRMIKQTGSTDFWVMSDDAQKKGFAKETKHYVPKLIAAALIAKHPEAFGFSMDEFQFEQPLQWDDLKLTQPMDLEAIARAAETDLETIQTLNPELKRWCTPPASEKQPYQLRIPKGATAKFEENLKKFGSGERLNFVLYKVKKGDTLSKIALENHSAAEAILKLNGLKSARSLRVNSELIVPMPNAKLAKGGKADPVFERQVAQARKAGVKPPRPEEEIPAGAQPSGKVVAGTLKIEKVESKTKVTYGVGQGDTLWSISQRFDVSIADLKNWNEVLERGAKRMRIGTSLTVWPGPKADLTVPKG